MVIKNSTPLKFHIGHPAYNGVNAMALANSRAQAISILRDRGLTRDLARKATSQEYSTTYVPNTFDVIEVARVY